MHAVDHDRLGSHTNTRPPRHLPTRLQAYLSSVSTMIIRERGSPNYLTTNTRFTMTTKLGPDKSQLRFSEHDCSVITVLIYVFVIITYRHIRNGIKLTIFFSINPDHIIDVVGRVS